ncbi:Two component regulator three Y domain-containing protein [Cytophaga sp. FL35]|uniref:helix-turn-helix and ligand-binding sensor domain-containing protein n=1 Tax=Cytophaga sp. FL35 TaxID=1904456 RepID=UPI001653D2DB|nr:Two component regulator three Y domain-containing protein [Cytophaga sp. FL35]MBC6997266.1 Two component regulator three Y domain-containing protein [Cytophaga sp. FL35]
MITRLLSFFFLVVPILLVGQNLLPPIYNYKAFEYNAAGQNWGLSTNEKGELFSANDKGLLYFNGEEWTLYKLPNATIIRSVKCIGDRIYTGSYEEFGFWKKEPNGIFKYTSLTHLITNHTFTNEEFWQILPIGDQIIFRSFSAIYIYSNNQINVVQPGFTVTHIAIHSNKIYVASKSKGLFLLEDEQLKPLATPSVFNDATIISMNSFKDKLLIGTQLKGAYFYFDGEATALETNINALLKQHQLNKVEVLSDQELAFGTIKNGIYLYDINDRTIKNLNRATGLQNNTVLSLTKFEDQIWAGLENGLDRIGNNSAITYFTDYSGLLGTTHDIVIQGKNSYLGSNTGIFQLLGNDLEFIPGSQGHVWDMELIEKDVMAGHNAGTFRVQSKSLDQISHIAGGYQFVKVPESNNLYLQGTYTGVALFDKRDEDWSARPVFGIDFPVKQLCFEDRRTLWAAHPYKGLFRFGLDDNLEKVTDKKEFGPDVLPNNYQVKLYRIKNQIIIQSDGKWFKYDPIIEEINLFKEFEAYNDKSLIYSDGDNFWFIDNKPNKELIYTNLKDQHISIGKSQLNERLVPDMEHISKRNDSIYLLTLSDGFAQLNLSKLQRNLSNLRSNAPVLSYFKDSHQSYATTDSAFAIPYKYASDIQLQVASPNLIKPRYYYELKGPLSQKKYKSNGNITFQNLPYGDYILKLHTVSMDNKISEPKLVQLSIAPPWFLSTYSILAYLIVLLSIILLIRWYNQRKLKRKQLALQIKLEQQQDERLAQLEKDRLEKEIKNKQNELARTTMSVAKKNELILELKDLMVLNKDAFKNKQRYRSLTKKLDSSINEDEDWQQFEVNFKELHNDFFENLLKEYPKLTPKDLKLCAYLKMNLSTKEIAPLMAITVRGVEIHRYRLRKKLGIDSSQNLSNYLIQYKQ